MTFDEFKTDFDAKIGVMTDEELLASLVEAGCKVIRTVQMRSWQTGKRWKDFHPQGVICYPVAEPDHWSIYRSHKTMEKSLAAAETLNRRATDGTCYEAVYFTKSATT